MTLSCIRIEKKEKKEVLLGPLLPRFFFPFKNFFFFFSKHIFTERIVYISDRLVMHSLTMYCILIFI